MQKQLAHCACMLVLMQSAAAVDPLLTAASLWLMHCCCTAHVCCHASWCLFALRLRLSHTHWHDVQDVAYLAAL